MKKLFKITLVIAAVCAGAAFAGAKHKSKANNRYITIDV